MTVPFPGVRADALDSYEYRERNGTGYGHIRNFRRRPGGMIDKLSIKWPEFATGVAKTMLAALYGELVPQTRS